MFRRLADFQWFNPAIVAAVTANGRFPLCKDRSPATNRIIRLPSRAAVGVLEYLLAPLAGLDRYGIMSQATLLADSAESVIVKPAKLGVVGFRCYAEFAELTGIH